MGDCEHSFHREEHEVTYWMYACLRCGKTELEIVRAQLASVTKERDEARESEHLSVKQFNRCSRSLSTAVAALEWYADAEPSSWPEIGEHARQALAAIRAGETRTAPSDSQTESIVQSLNEATQAMMGKANVRAGEEKPEALATAQPALQVSGYSEVWLRPEEKPECTCEINNVHSARNELGAYDPNCPRHGARESEVK